MILQAILWTIGIAGVLFIGATLAGAITQRVKEIQNDDEPLYTWTNQSNGAWVDTEEMRKELIADGVLKPASKDRRR